jgi:hypothetical protein
VGRVGCRFDGRCGGFGEEKNCLWLSFQRWRRNECTTQVAQQSVHAVTAERGRTLFDTVTLSGTFRGALRVANCVSEWGTGVGCWISVRDDFDRERAPELMTGGRVVAWRGDAVADLGGEDRYASR